MLRLQIHDAVEEDVLDIAVREPVVARRIAVLFEQLRGDPRLLSRLLEDRYGESGETFFSIRKWEEQWKKGNDLWRLKDWTLYELDLRYRLIYAYMIPTRSIYMLAVVHRSFDYDEDHPLGQEILRRYAELLEQF